MIDYRVPGYCPKCRGQTMHNRVDSFHGRPKFKCRLCGHVASREISITAKRIQKDRKYSKVSKELDPC